MGTRIYSDADGDFYLIDGDEDDDYGRDALVACDQCGNIGTVDAWPFVQWRELPSEGLGEGVMLCADCWSDAQAAMETTTNAELLK